MTNPIEVLQRPLFKAPAMVSVSSDAAQYAGRTTLSSGSATVTVSTNAVNSDSIIGRMIEAALPAGYTMQGRTSILSGIATGTVSTTAVYSGQVIMLGFESASNTTSGVGKGLRVNSIVDGVSFAITATDSFGYPGTINAMWRIPESVPEGVKVNTISSGNFFTLGWADGRARPVDTTILWELRKSS